jgi:hypothetical protein
LSCRPSFRVFLIDAPAYQFSFRRIGVRVQPGELLDFVRGHFHHQAIKDVAGDTTPALDLLLLGTVVELELSDRDRRVLQKRYDLLKPHLERPRSPLAPYLNDRALVYPQGSRAIGATVLYGQNDDQFDLDGILEFPTPNGWTPDKVLDQLYLGPCMDGPLARALFGSGILVYRGHVFGV